MTNVMKRAIKAFHKSVTEGARCTHWEMGGCFGDIDCHHLKRVGSHPQLRFTRENCIPVCRFHHSYSEGNRAWERARIEEMFPGRWDRLEELARTTTKVDPNDVIEELRKR